MASKKQKQREEASSSAALKGAPRAPLSPRVKSFLERRSLAIAVAAVVLATVRIIATYHVFDHTSDEPAHIACGMEWLDKGAYTWEPQHPPLSRVAAALGPYLIGDRSANTKRGPSVMPMFNEGAAILEEGGRYDEALALSRAAILPFFWIACWVLYCWGRRYFEPATAAIAVVFFSFEPTVLAHAGLATTDMALTAFLSATFLALCIWLEQPTLKHSIWLGTAAGLMVLSKFSCIVFLPASVGVALLWYLRRSRPGFGAILTAVKQRIPTFALACAIGFFLIWAGYRFSFGITPFTKFPLPFPQLWQGLKDVSEHNAHGHISYLLGEPGGYGFWDFFLVGLLYKTPLGLLALILAGLALSFRKSKPFDQLYLPAAFAFGILIVGIFSKINIGLRHVLPVYVGLSLVAAFAALHLLQEGDRKKWMVAACGVFTVWFMGASLIGHPDYLAYFNELAGSEPEKILVDSDLDWGQDQKRLGKRLKELGVQELAYTPNIVGDLSKHGFPPLHFIDRRFPQVGWNAVGVTEWKELRIVTWPDHVPPQERVGKSILLWYFPPQPGILKTGATPPVK